MMTRRFNNRDAVCASICSIVLCLMCLILGSPTLALADDTQIITEQIQKMDNLLQSRKQQDAMRIFRSLSDKYGDHPLVMILQARLFMMQKQVERSKQVLEKVLQKHPDFPQAQALLANIEIRSGNSPQGIKRMQDALAINPEAVELLTLNAEVKTMQRDLKGALPIWKKIAGNQDNIARVRANAYAKAGEIYAHQKNHEMSSVMLGYAVKLLWHPNLAMAHIQQLHQANHVQTGLDAIVDFKKQLKKPEYAQIRTKAHTQIRPIEQDLKFKNLPAKIASKDIKYSITSMQINFLRSDFKTKTDAQSQAKLKQLDAYELDLEVALLKQGIKKKFATGWMNNRIKTIRELAKSVNPARSQKALAYATEIEEVTKKEDAKSLVKAIALAKAGWSHADFYSPSKDQKEKLKKEGLANRLGSKTVYEALCKYYEELAVKRKAPAFEVLVEQFIATPSNTSLKKKIAQAFYEQVKDIDVTQGGASAIRHEILPNVVWTKTPKNKTEPTFPTQAIGDAHQLAYTHWNDFLARDLEKNQKWEQVLVGYDRISKIHPRFNLFISRAKVKFYQGKYQEAFEEMAVSVAIASWIRAHTYNEVYTNKKWDYTGVSQVHVLHDLAMGKPKTSGPYPSQELYELAQYIQKKQWAKIGPILTAKRDQKHSFIQSVISDIKLGRNGFTRPILDALGVEILKEKNADRIKAIQEQAKAMFSLGHHAFALAAAGLEKDLAKREEILLDAVRIVKNSNPRDAMLHMALGKIYEDKGDKRLARLHYNVAAMGFDKNKLSDPILQGIAQLRDNLDGVTDKKQKFALYVKDTEAVNTTYKESKYRDGIAAVRLDALCNRMLFLNVEPYTIYGIQSGVLKHLEDYKGAIRVLKEMVKINPKAPKGYCYALIGNYQKNLGQFDEALKSYKLAMDNGNEFKTAYMNKAAIQKSKGAFDQALLTYTQFLKIQPDSLAALGKRSKLYEYSEKNLEAALADAEKVLALKKSRKNKPSDLNDMLSGVDSDMVLNLRINNLKMKISQRKLNRMFKN